MAGLSLTASGVFLGYRQTSRSQLLARTGTEYHGKNNADHNQWIIRVEFTPRLLKTHLTVLEKNSQVLTGDVQTDLG